jgi:hypothetical protein
VRRDDATARSSRAVRHGRRNRELAATTDLHPLDAGVPAGNDLTLAELELERLPAVPGGVELLAVGEGDADVVHRHLLALRRLVTVADGEIFDAELEGDIAVRLVDLRPFECHGQNL